VPGSIAAAQWAQIRAAAPQVTVTIQRYLQRLAAFLAPASVNAAENALRQFARWMITDAGLDSIAAVRRDDIEDYKVWLAARPRAGGQTITAETHRQRIRTVRAFSGSDHRVGLARRAAPQPGHRRDIPKKPEPLPKFPGDRDAAKLMAAARASTGPRDRLVVELLARIGMRAGELAGLDAGAVVQIGAGHWLRIPLGKLRNDRYVPLHPELTQLLTAWTAANMEHIRHCKRLIADHRGTLDRYIIGRIVSRVARAAGVPGVHPRRLRHTLATQAINRGMSLEAIAALLGAYKTPQNGDDPHLRPHRQPGRRRRICLGQRQDRRPLRPAARTTRRLRERRHGPAAPRSTRPDARQRPVHPPRRTGLPPGIGLRDLRLLPQRTRVPAHPGPPARSRPRPRPGRPGRPVRRAHPARRDRTRHH
jgi:site-specific recombinase XerD